jgi:hypothetical protein
MQNISIPQLILDVVDVMQTHADMFIVLLVYGYILLLLVKNKMFGLFESSKTKRERELSIQQTVTNTLTSLVYKNQYEQLLQKYNDLVDRVNKKGGEDFLNNGSIHPQGIQITQEDIKTLIQLCHPDKHNSKESAVEITKKLLSLRQ